MIDIKELRETVEKTFGERITTNKQCKLLEENILKKTNRKISTSTLRRFFELLPSSSNLSTYNKDTLVLYSNYNIKKELTEKKNTLWEDVKKEAQAYTNYYIQGIKNKSLSDYTNSINRITVEKSLNSFIESKKNYTTLIAPGGYGKSTLLAKWLDNTQNSLTSNDIILFTNAIIFKNSFQINNKSKVIDLSAKTTNSLQLIKESNLQKGRFVIIIDAVDELSLSIEKLKRFINWFIELLTQNKETPWLKVILSARSVTYEKHLAPLFFQNKSSYKTNKHFSFIEDKINGYNYERNEVISIIQNSLNAQETTILLDQITNPDILSLLQIPINLALYLKHFAVTTDKSQIYTINLYQQILETYVFHSINFEEKVDIIETIINEQIKTSSFFISKNSLKKQHPIHLKQSSNYFHAYNDLLKDGVLHEFLQNDINNIPTYHISFKHVNIHYYLCAIHLIRQNGELTFELFEKVANEYGNLEFKINVIAYLFCIAYKNENLNAIKHFYNLDKNIINSINMATTVGMCLRNNNNIQEEIILNYAQNIQAQKYLFELFVDIDHLILGFHDQLSIYKKYTNTNQSNIYCTSLSLYHSLLTLNKNEAYLNFNALNNLQFNENIFPWPIGRYIGYSILFLAFCENTYNKYTTEQLLVYRNIAYKNFHSGYQKEYLFDITIVFALVLTMQYKKAIEYTNKVICHVETIERSKTFYYYAENFHYDVIQAILIYSKYKTSNTIKPEDIDTLTSFAVTNANHYSSFQYTAIINFYASEILYQSGNSKKAKEYFDMALSLCNYCKYDLLKAYILYNNPFNNQEFRTTGQQMFEKNGFLFYNMAVS